MFSRYYTFERANSFKLFSQTGGFALSSLQKQGSKNVCGEAVPALRPAGILPAVGNKGKMPSPRWIPAFAGMTNCVKSFGVPNLER